MDIRDRLDAHFTEQRAQVTRPDPGAVMERGETIKRRRRMAAVALPAAAVVVVAVGVLALRPGPGGEGLTEGGADLVAAQNAVLSVSDRQLEWETSPASIGWSMQAAMTDDVLYVLSTAPGARRGPNPAPVPEAIYASVDAGSWESHPVDSPWISGIAARNGLLYAVGTAPGAAADSAVLQVGVSEDRGATFQTTQLGAESATSPVDARLAVTGDGMLAFTPAVDGRQGNSAFWSADGQEFQPVEYPFDTQFVGEIFHVGDMAVVSTSADVGSRLFASDNARAWHRIAEEVPVGWVIDIGRVGEEFVLVGQSVDGNRPLAYRSGHLGGPWEEIPLADLLPASDPANGSFVWIGDAAFGKEGMALSVGFERDGSGAEAITGFVRELLPGGSPAEPEREPREVGGAILVTRDLRQWTISDLSEIGGIADQLMFLGDGSLTAHFTTQGDDGQPIRLQATTKP